MDNRKQKILQAIIEQFIDTAEPVGSQSIIVSYQLHVSPATVRNDMMKLEKEGMIEQPHTSAGRIPTELGYRYYIDELADFERARQAARQYIEMIRTEYTKEKIKQKVYDAIHLLAKAVSNICFATIPQNNQTFYIGVSNMLKKPEFQREPGQASQIIEVLEEKTNFIEALKNSDIDYQVKIFVGNENIIPQISSCGIIVTKYEIEKQEGYLGILGPKRMNYPFNAVILEEVRNLIQEY